MNRRYLALGALMVLAASAAVLSYLSPTRENPSAVQRTIAVNATAVFGPSNAMSRTVSVANGSSAFDAMDGAFDVDYEEFAGLGKMVVAIGGVRQNSTHHWFYSVDGRFGEVASDRHALYADSSVLFNFTDAYMGV